MTDSDCDEALECLKELAKQYGKELTESDTRVKMIDPMFMTCLGWNEKDIDRERHVHEGFIDYVFSIDGIPRFILEAKKVGESFRIPNSYSGRVYRTNGVIWNDNKIREAIEQAQQYCANSGVNYGVISNGNQYLIFEGFKRGKDWRQGSCVIFRSFEDIEKDFGLFWDILNKTSVKNGSLRQFISEDTVEVKYLSRPIDHLHGGSAVPRNNLSPFLQPLIEFVFKDIVDETQLDLLRSCYISRKQYTEAAADINSHLDVVPAFAKKYKTQDIIQSAEKAGAFEDAYKQLENLTKGAMPKGYLVVLMGGIGSGKTTFIHHFFTITKPAKTLWFYVDFFKVTEEHTKIEEHILKIMIEEFDRKYKNDFIKELSALKMDALTSSIKDVKALFSFLTLKGYTLSMVLDNVDQHSYVDAKYQEQALLVAKRLTDYLGAITILTLREESFFKSAMSGVLDSFPAQTFHISSPNFEDLIRVRINYVINLLAKSDDELGEIIRNPIAISVSREVVKTFFQIIENSLRSSRTVGREILRFLKDISGGDMRAALYFFRTFLVSGNTDVGEMLYINELNSERGLGLYEIPFHHVLKSIILEHSRLYRMSQSKIMNTFEFNSRAKSHFLNLRILNYLCNRLSYRPPQGRGFTAIDQIMEEGDRTGISKEAIEESLKTLVYYGLTQFENQSKEGFDNASYVRITNAGMYYLNILICRFAYLDLVWMDTPMTDRNTVEELLKHVVETRFPKLPKDIDERFHRTEIFLDYLGKAEKEELSNRSEFSDSDLTRVEFIPRVKELYEKEKAYIRSKRINQNM
jgi:KaiC/GvpD/RAD55 family RecA-like ATPase